MEIADALMLLAGCAAFFGGVAIFASIAPSVRRVRVSSSFRKEEAEEGTGLALLLRRGVPWCIPLARAALRIAFLESAFDEVVATVRIRGYATTVERACSVWCAVSLGIVVAGTLIGASPVFGAALAVCLSIACQFAAERSREARIKAMREEVPNALRAMESCFFAGLSLMQTFQHLADEASEPLAALFSQAAHGLEAGSTSHEVLGSLRSRASIPEISFIAIALEIQHDAGGSMKQVLEAARDSVESDLELRRALRVQTAQAKLSARVVTAMPFVLMALFSLITEDFLAPFFASGFGLALLAVAITMQVAGVLCVRNMLKVGFD